jgi:hypothetical protein
MTILLHGCEVWSLREDLFHCLRRFHNRCCRTMCRINMAHTIRHHITSNSLFSQLEVEPLDVYYNRRVLRWAGHVSRMPMSRTPCKLLTGWVAHTLPIGCPNMTWGRTLKKAIVSANIPTAYTEWRELDAQRDKWRELCGATLRREDKQVPAVSAQAAWAQLVGGPPPRLPASCDLGGMNHSVTSTQQKLHFRP